MNKVRRELPASAKCLQQRYSGKLMKAGDMATLTVYQVRPRKTFVFLVFCICLLRLANLRKINQRLEFQNKIKCGVNVADQMVRQ